MPNLSTHINFIKCLFDNNFEEYDTNYLTLGSIAPDYYIIFNNVKKGCLSHFKNEIFEISNLDYFQSKFLHTNFTYLEKSYIFGYYIHLWLDNYFIKNYSNLTINIDSSSFTPFLLNRFIKENIRIYDLRCSLEFIYNINMDSLNLNISNDILPISINKALNLFNDFKFKSTNRPLEVTCPTILNDVSYYEFINNACTEFLKEYKEF